MKFFAIKFEKIILSFFLFLLFACIIITYNKEVSKTVWLPVNKKVIVIDAGHGGRDPGKAANKGLDEHIINLEIVKYLNKYFELNSSITVLTRHDENALGAGKDEDFRNRAKVIKDSKPNVVISIHQNSFTDSSVKGPQVFYYKDSKESEKLAKAVQNQLNTFASPETLREEKENSLYLILKASKAPTIIVECGFLTNKEEEAKLNTKEYQEKIAWAIYMGVNDYFAD